MLGAALFGVYRVVAPRGSDTSAIAISSDQIVSMAEQFRSVWQRPPTREELEQLIAARVHDEVLYREGLALGLERDDPVVRNRVRQKVEALAEDASTAVPTDAELQAYLTANPKAFEIDPMLSFGQIFLNPQRHGKVIRQDAAAILEVLLSQPAADPALLGDTSLLPPELPLTSKRVIGQIFGADFAEAIDKAGPGQWAGPIVSTFGVHLVQVTERLPGRVPDLEEVREAVARDWTNARRKELEDRRFAELLKGYVVTIKSPAGAGTGS